MQNWLTEVKQYARSEATYMIFGNKNDLEASGQRQVNLIDGAKFAQENGKWLIVIVNLIYFLSECLFSEGSARTGQAVEAAFNKLTQTVIYKIDSGEINEESLSTQKRTSGND